MKNLLISKGYRFIIRSAGSHSPIDLLAADGKRKLAIQVKRRKYISKEEKALLLSWAASFDAAPVFASKVGGRWTFHLVMENSLKKIDV
ncbi:MAG: hypothetical protein QXV32_06570 [Conexivisphaerales archaeon]